jgi:hypothetical protein
MEYRKFRADQLFDGYRLLGDQHVLITTEDGKIEEIVLTKMQAMVFKKLKAFFHRDLLIVIAILN